MLNVLVTGAGGQLGSELRQAAEGSADNYIFTDVGELDITDAEAVARCVAGQKIGVIVNCAAYTDVERAEDDEPAAYKLNCTAAGNLADAAARNGALLIHISTDYVFGGTRRRKPITEDEAPSPECVYGATKLAGERAIAASGCRHIIIRTSWLYSPYGRNFVKTMLRLTAERESLKVVDDQTGTPTCAADLAAAIRTIIDSRRGGDAAGIYHYSDEGACTWYDLATETARMAGHDGCRIEPCSSAEYPSRAKRPAYSVLDKGKIRRTFGVEVPDWRESLKRCIEILNAK